jgi:hypothetical protein
MNIEAEARATKAISNVYSIRSWPDSSFQNLCINNRISSSPFPLPVMSPLSNRPNSFRPDESDAGEALAAPALEGPEN